MFNILGSLGKRPLDGYLEIDLASYADNSKNKNNFVDAYEEGFTRCLQLPAHASRSRRGWNGGIGSLCWIIGQTGHQVPYDCPLFCDGVCQRSAPPLIFSPALSYTALPNGQACTSQEQSISSSLMRDTGWADASRCLRANTALLSPYKYGPSTLLAKTVLPFPVI